MQKMKKYEAPFVLAIDIGTSSARAIVFDARGRRTPAAWAASYELRTPVKGAGQLDVGEVISAVVKSCRRAVAASKKFRLGNIEAVGLSGFFHSLIAVARDGKALTPVYTWADTRSIPQSLKLRKKLDARAVHERTGCVLHPVYLPSKILWLREEHRSIFRKARLFCSMKEYLVFSLFGRTFCDYSVAAGAGLLDIRKKEYDAELLKAVGVSPGRLSPLRNFNEKLTGLKSEYSKALGLSSGVPWFLGAGDAACSSIGSGCPDEKQMALMVGTSGAVRLITSRKNIKVPEGLWCYLVDRDHYLVGGAINNAGLVRTYLKKILSLPPDKELEKILLRRRPVSDSLTMLPFLVGERSPGWHARALASIEGLDFSTSSVDVFQAGLEAVGFRLFTIFELLKKSFPGKKEIIVSGGVARSPAWMKILANIFGIELRISPEEEASSRGAAILALRALGRINGFEVPAGETSRLKTVWPSPSFHSIYMKAFERHIRRYADYIKQLENENY